jgi:accessory gene regulator protein AgrB
MWINLWEKLKKRKAISALVALAVVALISMGVSETVADAIGKLLAALLAE